MREKTASGPRAVMHAGKAALEEVAFAAWRPLFGGQRLERPIFMIGCPRSGTSVAVSLLAQHPDLVDFSEAGEVWDPSRYADPAADHVWTAADVTPEEAARLHDRFEFARRWRSIGHRMGKTRLLNKHPRNSVRIEFLSAMFPDACFVHVIRDGRAVVHSMLQMIEREPERKGVPMGAFCKPPHWRLFLRDDAVEQAALQWREIVACVLAHRETLGERYYQFHYANLCADVRGVLGGVYAFAGLAGGSEQRLPERLEVRDYKWREALTAEQIDTINHVQAPLLRELGYEV